jgi:hypothetical protein
MRKPVISSEISLKFDGVPITDISCQKAKYHLITDIINPLGIGVKVSYMILSIFDMARAIGL